MHGCVVSHIQLEGISIAVRLHEHKSCFVDNLNMRPGTQSGAGTQPEDIEKQVEDLILEQAGGVQATTPAQCNVSS